MDFMTKLEKVNNFPNGKTISKSGLWSQIRKPLNSDADVFPTEICFYIIKENNHDLQSRVLTGLHAVTPAYGNESKILSYTSLKDILIALIAIDLLLTHSALT